MYYSRNDSAVFAFASLATGWLIGSLAIEAIMDLGWRWWLDHAYICAVFAVGCALGFRVGRAG